jgi:hypothetical protein
MRGCLVTAMIAEFELGDLELRVGHDIGGGFGKAERDEDHALG